MAIDKSFRQAPLGLDQLDPEEMGDEPAMEITIEDPESVEIGIDGQPILRIEEAEDDEEDFGANLADEIDPSELQKIASDLVGDFDSDIGARKEWIQTYVDGLELLGMKIEERSEPGSGADRRQRHRF
jgi:hypothetical protein